MQKAQLGLTDPELGYIQLSKLQRMNVRLPPDGSASMGIEQEAYFKPNLSLSAYAEAARQSGAITDDAKLLDAAQERR